MAITPDKAANKAKPPAATVKAEIALADRATALGWVLEGDYHRGYRIVNAETGTLVAAAWANVGGYGLDLKQIEVALQGG